MNSDYDLYRLFLSGDISAYDQLLLRYGDRLIFYLYGYLHNWHDSEDLMIESFARIMAKKPLLKTESFKAYLYKVARNLAVHQYRWQSRHREFSPDDPDTEMADPESPENIYFDRNQKEILDLCLKRIDPIEREALYLVYMEGLSYKETADIMHVTTKKIDHLLENGKKHMRKELEKEGVTDAHQ